MKTLRDEKGMVLLLVLAVVALLTSLLTEFAFSTLVDLRLTETFRDSTRAWYLAKGGIEAGKQILKLEVNDFDHPNELWGIGVSNYPVGENGAVTITIHDLDGKLNINKLFNQNTGNTDPVFKDRFLRLLEELQQRDPQIDPPAMTDALIDWLDSGDQAEPYGAEGEYYSRLPDPYPVKNSPLDTVEELLLVKGFTPEIFKVISPFLTVHGGTTLNVNTAPAMVLAAWDKDMDMTIAERIVEQREKEPFETKNEVSDFLTIGVYSALNRNSDIEVKSSNFRIISDVTVGDAGTRRAIADVSKVGQGLQAKIHTQYLKVD